MLLFCYVAKRCFFLQQTQIGTINFANLDRFKFSLHSFKLCCVGIIYLGQIFANIVCLLFDVAF